jgi:hypothetical protein
MVEWRRNKLIGNDLHHYDDSYFQIKRPKRRQKAARSFEALARELRDARSRRTMVSCVATRAEFAANALQGGVGKNHARARSYTEILQNALQGAPPRGAMQRIRQRPKRQKEHSPHALADLRRNGRGQRTASPACVARCVSNSRPVAWFSTSASLFAVSHPGAYRDPGPCRS